MALREHKRLIALAPQRMAKNVACIRTFSEHCCAPLVYMYVMLRGDWEAGKTFQYMPIAIELTATISDIVVV